MSALRQFLTVVEDFGNMGSGDFKRKYPDYEPLEGYAYIQRKARALIAKMEADNG